MQKKKKKIDTIFFWKVFFNLLKTIREALCGLFSSLVTSQTITRSDIIFHSSIGKNRIKDWISIELFYTIRKLHNKQTWEVWRWRIAKISGVFTPTHIRFMFNRTNLFKTFQFDGNTFTNLNNTPNTIFMLILMHSIYSFSLTVGNRGW
jgi:hypothetical protein